MDKSDKFILWFDEVSIEDVGIVGGKNASLGEMYVSLSKSGVNVPFGFAVTAAGYRHFLRTSNAEPDLKRVLSGLNVKNVVALSAAGEECRHIISHCDWPHDLKQDIILAYRRLCQLSKRRHVDVAVRSSATAEDLPDASFAGQQETFLNIKGEHDLLDACKHCFASLFTNRAIAYRSEKGFDHFKVALSIGVQRMVRSDASSAGVIFTLDTESGFKDVVYITGSYGLGENVVQGAVNPDEWYVFKPTLKKGFRSIVQKKIGEKATKIIYSSDGTRPIKKIDTPLFERNAFCLNDSEILRLASWACIIEDHYSKKRGKWTPMDIEWAKDGFTNELFIVQARPETVHSSRRMDYYEEYSLKKKGRLLVSGKAVGKKISKGRVHVIKDVRDIARFVAGEILVTEMTDPDWVPIMRVAKAIVTNRGGRTSHAAIVSRELGLPCIVGTNNATDVLRNGQVVTVSCAEGELGRVYEGALDFGVKRVPLLSIPKLDVKIMMNIGNPDEAFELSMIPNSGVGLAREEFIINEFIRVHPMALLQPHKVDSDSLQKIEELTRGYKNKQDFFVEKLAQGIGTIGAAFYPNDVVVRFSDFKTNEYAALVGGKNFEPVESNPMIGWRGAARYYDERYAPAFALECKALAKARDEFGLQNIKCMIPMCRSPEEGRKVIRIMEENGLKRHHNGLQVYVMCEIPVNVILADEYCEIFDGFSIGSNDLTQFTMGVDRDSELVSHLYDERSSAVKQMISLAIHTAKKHKKKIGICGDMPSTFPEMAVWLAKQGIDSISLSPDAVVGTTLYIAHHLKK
ncbi:phosphoenolpyruvate synthase [Candidatus Woesearchaeota archaeon]|nr:phosphoenolpyruvate synthase [Candidatus Woesearchaeota archaeon]